MFECIEMMLDSEVLTENFEIELDIKAELVKFFKIETIRMFGNKVNKSKVLSAFTAKLFLA